MRSPWHQGCEPKLVRRWLRTLGISVERYKEWSGYRALADFGAANPSWPLRALVGLLLEALEEGVLVSTPEPVSLEAARPRVVDADTDPEDESDEPAGAICCAGCGVDSGAVRSGADRFSQPVQAQLRPKGWAILSGTHLAGARAAARCWVCPACLPSWREGLATKDATKIHGSTHVRARQDA